MRNRSMALVVRENKILFIIPTIGWRLFQFINERSIFQHISTCYNRNEEVIKLGIVNEDKGKSVWK